MSILEINFTTKHYTLTPLCFERAPRWSGGHDSSTFTSFRQNDLEQMSNFLSSSFLIWKISISTTFLPFSGSWGADRERVGCRGKRVGPGVKCHSTCLMKVYRRPTVCQASGHRLEIQEWVRDHGHRSLSKEKTDFNLIITQVSITYPEDEILREHIPEDFPKGWQWTEMWRTGCRVEKYKGCVGWMGLWRACLHLSDLWDLGRSFQLPRSASLSLKQKWNPQQGSFWAYMS